MKIVYRSQEPRDFSRGRFRNVSFCTNTKFISRPVHNLGGNFYFCTVNFYNLVRSHGRGGKFFSRQFGNDFSNRLAFVSTAICLILAYPLCLILIERAKSAGLIITLLFVLPLWMNTLLSTMAWQTILEKNGIINQILRLLALPDFTLINTQAAVVLGMIYNYLPYMVLPLYVALSKIDKSVIEAAKDLGASTWQTFLKVILPLSLPGAVSGVTMVFIPALTTFAISALLGGGKVLLIGNVIEQEFTFEYDWNLGAALSIVLMIFIVLNMILTFIFDKGAEE